MGLGFQCSTCGTVFILHTNTGRAFLLPGACHKVQCLSVFDGKRTTYDLLTGKHLELHRKLQRSPVCTITVGFLILTSDGALWHFFLLRSVE